MSFKYDFVKNRNLYFIISALLTVAGIVCLLTIGLTRGVDFESGSRVNITANEPLTNEKVESEFKSLGFDPESVVLAGKNNTQANVAFKGVLSKDEIAKLNTHFDKKYGEPPSVSTVTPTVGRELAKNAIIAVLIASVGIIIYVAFRFEWSMSIAAIIALFHDAFMIVAIFSMFKIEVDLPFIAAVLTIVGYSINDTIVTFDRIRENMRLEKVKSKEKLAEIVNRSIHETLSRSINTVLTVVIGAVALLIFGADSIHNFSVALLIGLIFGAYSSIFIASQLWYILKSRQLKTKKPRTAEAEPQI
ncbi:preprotein translocase subunit SecF [Fictibacillus barbaricus]|uniref:Protein-export membrane protein SecF n=1 Tax=Fictibacillus barbaricus TaxID=182136 RepID=A0ABU1U2E8_9BACL|nr:preprotein translocase subunit SecF [Fictibacillus barbaricus]